MHVTLELSAKIEAGLAALAAARGLALPQYLQRLLEEQASFSDTRISPSVADRAAAWGAVGNLPIVPPLSDEAIGRDTLYDVRG